jgi:hypothetical protein
MLRSGRPRTRGDGALATALLNRYLLLVLFLPIYPLSDLYNLVPRRHSMHQANVIADLWPNRSLMDDAKFDFIDAIPIYGAVHRTLGKEG